ncbi:RNA-directed DNA polymerase from mobile element jockey-like [Brachionus plicatilis]|uniref:RNA-directed DNA polymerase from mobile element jockey-like n=1 Tax=Brachionus plicatilis TaxID=10195 RepID=A0A3M7QFL0_BRAPC|nr:RNA-directed DNA polymerase from mobile element jockey-like [Brachionus plicatilis]
MMEKLIGKVEPEIWRILKNYYQNSLVFVQKKDEISSMFKTTVGVKQGGPLSPKLFSIYVEELIEEIMNTNLISEIDGIKTGVLILITFYGLENCKISKCEMRKLQTMEGLMIKQTLSLEKRSRTTNLFFSNKELKVNDESAFIKELREILGSSDQITKENLIKKERELKKEDFEKSKNGICDSIKYCLQNLKERKEELKLLVKAYLLRTEPNAEFV